MQFSFLSLTWQFFREKSKLSFSQISDKYDRLCLTYAMSSDTVLFSQQTLASLRCGLNSHCPVFANVASSGSPHLTRFSDMRFATTIAAVILSLLPALASAQGESITSIEGTRLTFGGFTNNYVGLRHDLTGRYNSGFQYDATLSAGEITGDGPGAVALASASLDMRYLWNGMIGPQVGAEYVRVDGVSERRTTAGIAGAYSFANGTTVDGALVSYTSNFGNDGTLTLNARHPVNSDMRVYGGITLDHIESETMRSLKLGMRYNISRSMFLDGSVAHSRLGEVRANNVSVGVGFSF